MCTGRAVVRRGENEIRMERQESRQCLSEPKKKKGLALYDRYTLLAQLPSSLINGENLLPVFYYQFSTC